jgi:hypothetical protein
MTKRERERLEKIKQIEDEELMKAEEENKPVKGLVEVDEIVEQDHPEFKDEKSRKLHELKLKMNQARKLNNQAVIEENDRVTNPQYDRIRKHREWKEENDEFMKDIDKKGMSKEKKYLTDTMGKTEKMKKRNGKKKITFGWDVFNDDAIYRAYDKRADKLQKDEVDTSTLNEEDKKKIEDGRLSRLVEDIEAQKNKRDNFKRRRTEVEEKDVDYINERNKNFNKKLERNFSKYATEIKANIERGSAI